MRDKISGSIDASWGSEELLGADKWMMKIRPERSAAFVRPIADQGREFWSKLIPGTALRAASGRIF